MKGKATLLVGLATGYVLGTRDGHERYEQIKAQAERVWKDPRVQEKASQAQDLAKEKAPVVKDKVAEAGKKAQTKAKSKTGGKDKSDTGSAPLAEPAIVQPTTPVGSDPLDPDPIDPDPIDSDPIIVTPASTTLPGSSPRTGGLDG
jgi:hypothetical protein